ncbi:MAG: M16 family metallopeptidase [Pseudomonadota bacterium]
MRITPTRLAGLAAVLLPLCLLPARAAATAPASELRLANGLHVIVQEDHRAPVVMVQVWYRVGATHEPPGLTGISHVLEHMMFKGTADVGPGELAKLVSRFGGSQNAFTAAHYTGYYQYYDKSRLPLALALEADRMRQLVIDENEFRKEIEVVREERRMRVEDNPVSTAWERIRAVAHLGSPSGQPVIGWPHDLSNISVASLRDWYDTWYAPNNAVLVVVGDVQANDVFRQAERQFGALKSRRLPVTAAPRTPDNPGLREMTLPVATRVPTLAMIWNVPGLQTADPKGNDAWALSVLAGVLDGGMSARLEKELVRKRKIAASAGAGYDALERGDSLFSVHVVPAQGKTLDDARKAVREMISALRDQPPSDEELARVKAQVVAELVYDQDSLSGQAQLIGALASMGYDWRLKDSWADNIRKVTAADVQRVARTWLVDERLTTARIVPVATNDKGR